jgi:TRAP-type C4-dicarboxylate transport system permease small subunit
MRALEKWAKALAKIMYWIAGLAIVSMMLLTCFDVILRGCVTVYHSSRWGFLENVQPIAGTYELVRFMSAVAASFALAHTTVEKGHVAVSFVVAVFPEKVQDIIEFTTLSFGFILFAVISWQSVIYGFDLRASGEVSLTIQLPFYPFVWGIGFAAAAVCFVIFVDLARSVVKVVEK